MARLSLNNRFLLESYKEDRAIKTQTLNGFAMVQQKVSLKGLKLLVGAQIVQGNISTYFPVGSVAFVREEYLVAQQWAKKIFQSEGISGEFIIVDSTYVEFVQTSDLGNQ